MDYKRHFINNLYIRLYKASPQNKPDQLDSFHRSQLRQLIGSHIESPTRHSTYAAKVDWSTSRSSQARWQIFGHVLRLRRDVPTQCFVDEYFNLVEYALVSLYQWCIVKSYSKHHILQTFKSSLKTHLFSFRS